MTFRGIYEYVIDDRGRVAIPARYRDLFSPGIVLAQGPDGCVEVYTIEDYERVSEFVLSEPANQHRGRRLRRGFFSLSWDGELDRQGRILIPVPLRQWADLNGPVVVTGRRDCLEIWNADRWQSEKVAIEQEFGGELEALS